MTAPDPCFTDLPGGTVTDSDAYAVYTVIVDSIERPPKSRGVVYATTAGNAMERRSYDYDAPPEWADAVRAFNRANLTPLELVSLPPFDGRWKLQTRAQIDLAFGRRNASNAELAKDPGWNSFFRAYPFADGLLVVSAVGFNREHTRALVSWSFECNEKCGSASMAAFEKTNGMWREVHPAGLKLFVSVS